MLTDTAISLCLVAVFLFTFLECKVVKKRNLRLAHCISNDDNIENHQYF